MRDFCTNAIQIKWFCRCEAVYLQCRGYSADFITNELAYLARVDNIMIFVQAYFQAKLYSYIVSKDTAYNYNNDERKLILHQKTVP